MPLAYPTFIVTFLHLVSVKVDSFIPAYKYTNPPTALPHPFPTKYFRGNAVCVLNKVEPVNISIPSELQKNSLSATTVIINYNNWV